jgi:hypothetical protein
MSRRAELDEAQYGRDAMSQGSQGQIESMLK